MHVIRIHADAPPKPAAGAACNGCGVCCLAEPCPAGMLVSGRRQGACSALIWEDDGSRYRCGLVSDPARFVRPRWLARGLAPLARRWISAGSGCDCELETQRPSGA